MVMETTVGFEAFYAGRGRGNPGERLKEPADQWRVNYPGWIIKSSGLWCGAIDREMRETQTHIMVFECEFWAQMGAGNIPKLVKSPNLSDHITSSQISPSHRVCHSDLISCRKPGVQSVRWLAVCVQGAWISLSERSEGYLSRNWLSRWWFFIQCTDSGKWFRIGYTFLWYDQDLNTCFSGTHFPAIKWKTSAAQSVSMMGDHSAHWSRCRVRIGSGVCYSP